MKEIKPKDNDEYELINERLKKKKNEIKIYDIIEENKKIYIVIDKENDLKIENLLNPNEIKENIISGQGNPIKKRKLINYFKWKMQCVKYIMKDLKIIK